MTDDKNELEELARGIRKIISENEQFLARIMEDDFAEDDEESFDPPEEL